MDCFTTTEVNSLAWVMRSPNLLSDSFLTQTASVATDSWCHNQYEHFRTQLLELDKNPTPLLEHLEQHLSSKSRRLGIYFEALVGFWLKYFLKPQTLYQNIQVRDSNRTLGEFDLIYFDHETKTYRHWELAVKYYLFFEKTSNESSFLGPNGKDRLDLKLKKMVENQLKLSTMPEAKAKLLSLGITNLISNLFVKGFLFYPKNSWTTASPQLISKQHGRGWWIYHSQLLELSDSNKDWIILDHKKYWICDTQHLIQTQKTVNSSQLFDYCETHFKTNKSSISVIDVFEASRGFIVANEWPFLSSSLD